MKKIFKIVTFVFALSMVMGLGMVKGAWAAEMWEDGGGISQKCPYCGLTFSSTEILKHLQSCTLSSIPDGDEYTSIDLQNSVESIQYDTLNKTNGTTYYTDETTNVWSDGQIVEECRVTVALESTFTITIPKEIILDGSTKKADYTVNVQGDIAGDQLITVIPDSNLEMIEDGGKDNVTATVSQTQLTFPYMLISPVDGATTDGYVEALDLTAGNWSGKFNFNITFGENNE